MEKQLIQIADNSKRKLTEENEPPLTEKQLANLREIAGVPIKNINLEDNPNLLVFPQFLSDCKDKIQDSPIFSLEGNEYIRTNNIMGFIGYKDTRLRIHSRFAQTDEQDFFLHYMLQKVFAVNLFDLKYTSDKTDIFDFLIYLFPAYLKQAFQQGLYKEYQTHNYNDAHIRGRIDIARHIRQNFPFTGKVAYQIREYSYNNDLTQLIRHTIEYIHSRQFARNILHNDSDTKDAVKTIESATPTYNRQDRQRIIYQNLRPTQHPYFSEYRPLQQLCLQILRHDELKYGSKNDEIYGILFDGAWLWEEYLAIVLKDRMTHYVRGRNTQYLFTNPSSQPIVPDFLSKGKHVVADAKYIPLDSKHIPPESESALAIYYKTLVYMYRFDCQTGYLLYPYSNDTEIKSEVLTINNQPKHKLNKLGMVIPQGITDWHRFVGRMQSSEEDFTKRIVATNE